MAAGAAHGIVPIGSEGSHALRVEKGFLSLGHEADGTADPVDLGMGWILSRTKADYIGKRALEIRRSAGTRRRELVGLLFDDPKKFVIEGSPITPGGRREKTEGFVSACVWSVVRDRVVALGLIENGRARRGEKAFARMMDEVVEATIVAPIFHDPDGTRMKS
jgi:sarcosine oxidase subunit alpha